MAYWPSLALSTYSINLQHSASVCTRMHGVVYIALSCSKKEARCVGQSRCDARCVGQCNTMKERAQICSAGNRGAQLHVILFTNASTPWHAPRHPPGVVPCWLGSACGPPTAPCSSRWAWWGRQTKGQRRQPGRGSVGAIDSSSAPRRAAWVRGERLCRGRFLPADGAASRRFAATLHHEGVETDPDTGVSPATMRRHHDVTSGCNRLARPVFRLSASGYVGCYMPQQTKPQLPR